MLLVVPALPSPLDDEPVLVLVPVASEPPAVVSPLPPDELLPPLSELAPLPISLVPLELAEHSSSASTYPATRAIPPQDGLTASTTVKPNVRVFMMKTP